MCEAEHVPHDRTTPLSALAARGGGRVVDEPVAALHHGLDTAFFLAALVGELAGGPELLVAVARDPEVVLGVRRARRLRAVLVREHELRGVRRKLVPDVLAADGVLLIDVLELHYTIELGFGVGEHGALDLLAAHLVAVAKGVGLRVHGDGVGLFEHHGRVGAAVRVDAGVDAHGEDVLVVLGQDAGEHDVTITRGLALIYGHYAHDTSGPGLDRYAAGSVKLVGEYVLVIGERGYELDYELPKSCDYSTICSEVGVFPANACAYMLVLMLP